MAALPDHASRSESGAIRESLAGRQPRERAVRRSNYLFKTTKRTKRKTNLLVMLTPYIIKNRRDLQAIRTRKLREHDEFARSISTLDRMSYQPRIDYRKKRGLVDDINRAIEGVEHDIAVRGAIVRPPPVEAGRIDVD